MDAVYQIPIGKNCNLRCSYCYQKNMKPQSIPVEDCLSFLRACYRRDFEEQSGYMKFSLDESPRLFIIGGEPFLYMDHLNAVMEEFTVLNKKYGFKRELPCCITTNATLISRSKPVQDFLLRYKKRLSIRISIDGTKEAHDRFRRTADGKGSYDAAVEGLLWCLQNLGADVTSVNSVLSNATLSSFADGIIKLLEIGVRKIAGEPLDTEAWPAEKQPLYEEQINRIADYIFAHNLYGTVSLSALNVTAHAYKHKIVCACGKNKLCLGFDRKVYPCPLYAADEIGSFAHVEKERIVMDSLSEVPRINAMWKDVPLKCRLCPVGDQCRLCPWAVDLMCSGNAARFSRELTKCGWTRAKINACNRLSEMIEAQHETGLHHNDE